MNNDLEELLDSGEDLINRIEPTRNSVENRLSDLGGSANDIDEALLALTMQADDLHRQIAALRTQAPHRHDPVALATTQAIDNLTTLLGEAKGYFAAGEKLAAYGTLIMFDDHAEDLKAAIRLCQMAQRREKWGRS